VTLEQLRSIRPYFIVIAFIIAAIVTPPDVVSQLLLAIPMCCCLKWDCLPRGLSAKNRQLRQIPQMAITSLHGCREDRELDRIEAEERSRSGG